jgi:hypothetical protein
MCIERLRETIEARQQTWLTNNHDASFIRLTKITSVQLPTLIFQNVQCRQQKKYVPGIRPDKAHAVVESMDQVGERLQLHGSYDSHTGALYGSWTTLNTSFDSSL